MRKLFYLFVLIILLGTNVTAQIKNIFIETKVRSGGSVMSKSMIRLTNNGLFYKITWQSKTSEIDSTSYYFIPINNLDSSLISRYVALLYVHKNLISKNVLNIDYKNDLDKYNIGGINRIIFYNFKKDLITTHFNFYIQDDPLFEFYYLLINMIKNKVHRNIIINTFFSKQKSKLLNAIYQN